VAGETLDAADARITLEAGQVGIDFRPTTDLVVTFQTTGVGGSTSGTTTLTPPEGWVVDVLSSPPDRLALSARADVAYGGQTVEYSALLVWVDDRPIDIRARGGKRPGRRRRRP
jgi:hypothetical protein